MRREQTSGAAALPVVGSGARRAQAGTLDASIITFANTP